MEGGRDGRREGGRAPPILPSLHPSILPSFHPSCMPDLSLATFGGGCFWCLDAVFRQLKGVEKVESGYAGGTVKNPSYREVCSGTTGHAEVVQVTFDPAVLSYRDLLGVFFTIHDPTTLNRQGADVGTQYRSVIFYHKPEQKQTERYCVPTS